MDGKAHQTMPGHGTDEDLNLADEKHIIVDCMDLTTPNRNLSCPQQLSTFPCLRLIYIRNSPVEPFN